MKEIIKKLSYMQRTLAVPKNQVNSFGNYTYRNAEEILASVKKIMPDNVALIITDSVQKIEDRFYIVSNITFTDGDSEVSVNALSREPLNKKGMDDAQLTGSCSSYAKKYALQNLFLLDDNKDIDSGMSVQKPSQPPMSQEDALAKLKDLVLFHMFLQSQQRPTPLPLSQQIEKLCKTYLNKETIELTTETCDSILKDIDNSM